MDDKSISIIPRNEVHILVTEEDKTGEDILAMYSLRSQECLRCM